MYCGDLCLIPGHSRGICGEQSGLLRIIPPMLQNLISFSVDKKNQLDVTFYSLFLF